MKRSKGTYLQGVIEAERLVESLIENNLDIRETLIQMSLKGQGLPIGYYDGNDFIEGWHDFMEYFLDNEELIRDNKTQK